MTGTLVTFAMAGAFLFIIYYPEIEAWVIKQLGGE